MRALVTGAGGQVGRELVRLKPDSVELLALTRSECDINDPEAIVGAFRRLRPDIVINAAAYTDVDGAESDADAAFRANRDGPANLADAAKRTNARLIHISTDYVFDGRQGTPYSPDSDTSPLSVYGSSKLAGEQVVLQSHAAATIVRTGWVYSEFNRNFVLTILRLLLSGKPLKIVSDQVGAPTAAYDFAGFLWKYASQPVDSKILHWSNAGAASWYDFAVAIGELAREHGLISGELKIEPVSTVDYYASMPNGTRTVKHAERPRYSVLDSFEAWNAFGTPRHWRAALSSTLERFAAANSS